MRRLQRCWTSWRFTCLPLRNPMLHVKLALDRTMKPARIRYLRRWLRYLIVLFSNRVFRFPSWSNRFRVTLTKRQRIKEKDVERRGNSHLRKVSSALLPTKQYKWRFDSYSSGSGSGQENYDRTKKNGQGRFGKKAIRRKKEGTGGEEEEESNESSWKAESRIIVRGFLSLEILGVVTNVYP